MRHFHHYWYLSVHSPVGLGLVSNGKIKSGELTDKCTIIQVDMLNICTSESDIGSSVFISKNKKAWEFCTACTRTLEAIVIGKEILTKNIVSIIHLCLSLVSMRV